jgi:hypothetical protein
MNIAISNPLYQVSGMVDQVTVSDSSISYMETVRKRMENVGIHNNGNINEIHSTFQVIYKFRTLIKDKDYTTCIQVIQSIYGCNDDNLEALIKIALSNNSNILTSAKKEVKIICFEVFQYMWKRQAVQLLCSGALKGSRGALEVFSISWDLLDKLIDSYKLLPEVSTDCVDLFNLVVSVRNVRREVGLSYFDIENVLNNLVVTDDQINYDSLFCSIATKINFIA